MIDPNELLCPDFFPACIHLVFHQDGAPSRVHAGSPCSSSAGIEAENPEL
jgi:hypothetical protein